MKWKTCTIADIGTVVGGATPSTKKIENYENGNIELVRSSTYNENLVINKYEPFCISGGNSSSGSSSGGSSSSPEPLPPLNRMNITGIFETYGDPTECVFTYIRE